MGNAIHEIGHAVGLWHEQSREDRDLFVTINWQNIQAGRAAQFNQHITDGDDLGAYDYGSIMHYSRTAFSRNGQETITPTAPNAQIGQRDGLSAGDIASVQQMYPGCGVTKSPWRDIGKPKWLGDPQVIKSPFRDVKISWRDPKSPVFDPKSPYRDPKPMFSDPKLPFGDPKSPRFDPKPPFDPGPIKAGYDPMPISRPAPITRPVVAPTTGFRWPFNIATPHHLLFGRDADPGGGGAEAYVGELEYQVRESEAAAAHAWQEAAHAYANAASVQEAAEMAAHAYQDVLSQYGGGF